MTYRVHVATCIADVEYARWDALVNATKAPIFYHRAFLEAFERYPLHPVERTAYVTVVAPDGRTAAILPAYLQRGTDPMRVLASHFADLSDKPTLLSHVWHCYRTTLPTDPDHADAIPTAVVTLRDLARQWGASTYGFVNVGQQDQLSDYLEQIGVPGLAVETGWDMDLTRFDSFEAYLATLPSKRRIVMRQYLRRAHEDGVITRSVPARDGDLEGFVHLARRTAEKFNNADYYHPQVFPNFVLALGDRARLIELYLGPRLFGSMLMLLDDTRLHLLAAGFDLTESARFSPFYLLFAEALREGLARGSPRLEAGRRNPDFKRRHGLNSAPLMAHIARTPAHTG